MPDFLAQMRGNAEPDMLAVYVFREPDFPYGRKPPYAYVEAMESAASALIEFHDVWMRFTEGNNHG